jgi:NADH:ubiquinone oxidoreductase subunit
MGLLSCLGVLSPVHIYAVTFLTGARRIGRDTAGNVYVEAKARKGYNHPRRWVMYKGAPDPTTVPPEWHGWLHYQTDTVPNNTTPSYRRAWQKPHQPNRTGTSQTYLPPGHLLKGGTREAATGDYTPWVPEQPHLAQSHLERTYRT